MNILYKMSKYESFWQLTVNESHAWPWTHAKPASIPKRRVLFKKPIKWFAKPATKHFQLIKLETRAAAVTLNPLILF